jgi:hypothetical protein
MSNTYGVLDLDKNVVVYTFQIGISNTDTSSRNIYCVVVYTLQIGMSNTLSLVIRLQTYSYVYLSNVVSTTRVLMLCIPLKTNKNE